MDPISLFMTCFCVHEIEQKIDGLLISVKKIEHPPETLTT